MNCPEFQNWLQEHLDGEASAESAEAESHLAVCASCRELRSAASRLIRVLRSQNAPAFPDRMSEQIVSHILNDLASQDDARKRWKRRLGAVAALAASLLLAALGYSWWQSNRKPGAPNPKSFVIQNEKPAPAQAQPSLNIQEAGSALVALVNRTADETVGQSRLLLPQRVSAPSLPASENWQTSLEPGALSLREAQEGVTSGFEPVTSSARRAVNLFLREIPPMETQKQ
jgi:hypothetical protein